MQCGRASGNNHNRHVLASTRLPRAAVMLFCREWTSDVAPSAPVGTPAWGSILGPVNDIQCVQLDDDIGIFALVPIHFLADQNTWIQVCRDGLQYACHFNSTLIPSEANSIEKADTDMQEAPEPLLTSTSGNLGKSADNASPPRSKR